MIMAVRLVYPVGGEAVDLCARYQKDFESCRGFREEKKLIRRIIRETKTESDNTSPAPVTLRWESDRDEATVEISATEDFGEFSGYSVRGSSLQVYNLRKNTVYFWRVDKSRAESFVTDGVMPRWIRINGIGNVRDIGGRKNADGTVIKQGLIYRGFRLDDAVNAGGIEQLRELGIRTELDLRDEAAGVYNKSLIGDDVNYIQLFCSGYRDFVRDNVGDGKCRKLIETLADEENYPIYFHCHGGADRTGTLAFLLDAILGLDDETMLREYELTMMASPEKKLSRSRKGKFKPFIKYLRQSGGRKSSLRDCTMKFLADAGVTEETIRRIRDNLLEK